MKLNMLTKIVFVLLIIAMLSTAFKCVISPALNVAELDTMGSVYAIPVEGTDASGGGGGGSSVDIPTASGVTGGADVSAQKIVGALITIIQVVAFGAAVIMLMFLGIKYITASPDGKAEIKKSATQYIVGAVILFAATGILTIIKNFAISNI